MTRLRPGPELDDVVDVTPGCAQAATNALCTAGVATSPSMMTSVSSPNPPPNSSVMTSKVSSSRIAFWQEVGEAELRYSAW